MRKQKAFKSSLEIGHKTKGEIRKTRTITVHGPNARTKTLHKWVFSKSEEDVRFLHLRLTNLLQHAGPIVLLVAGLLEEHVIN